MFKKKSVIFSSLFYLSLGLLYQINFGRLVLVLLVIGQVCVSLHPQDLDKVGHFRRLKSAVGHEHVNVKNRNINHQLLKILFLPLEDRLNCNILVADKGWPSTATTSMSARRLQTASGRGPEFRFISLTLYTR